MTDVFFLSGILILGWLIVRFFMRRAGPLLTLCMVFPVGAGIFTFAQFVLSWMGGAIFGVSALVILAALNVLFFMLNIFVQVRPVASIAKSAEFEDGPRPVVLPWLLGGILVVILLLAVWFSVMRSFSRQT